LKQAREALTGLNEERKTIYGEKNPDEEERRLDERKVNLTTRQEDQEKRLAEE